MSDKEKIKTLHWLVAFLIVALIAAGVYIVNNELNDESYVKENTAKDDKKELYENDISEVLLDTLGRKLYDMVDVSLFDGLYYYFFAEENMNQNSFDNSEKLGMVLENINLDDGIYHNFINFDRIKSNDAYQSLCHEDMCIVYYVSKKKFEEAVTKLWGQNNNVKIEQFWSKSGICWDDSENQNYLACVIPTAYGDESDAHEIMEYAGTKMVDTNVVVSVKYLRVFNSVDQRKLYSDLKMKKEIQLSTEDEEKLNSYDINDEDLFEKYGDKAGVFEVTFKKDSFGNYYYYSTEYVD